MHSKEQLPRNAEGKRVFGSWANKFSTMLDPKCDFVFKKIFSDENIKEPILSFLNSVLQYPIEKKIVDLAILNTEVSKSSKNDKESRFDVRVKLADGKFINIEIQVDKQDFYKKRIVYYLAKLYEQKLSSGDNYKQLNQAISIHILNFNLFNDSKNDVFHRSFRFFHPNTNTEYSDNIELHNIELKKSIKILI